MPEYEYLCPNGHHETFTERMFYSTAHICIACGSMAWRKPQLINVTWGGLKPSAGDISPAIAEHVANAEANQERVQEEVRQNQEQERHREDDLFGTASISI